MEPKRWQKSKSKTIMETRIFKLREDGWVSPITHEEHPFWCLDPLPWVNIIPLTVDRQVIMIRQFRFGVEKFTLEIPGGMCEKPDEPPVEAARRELLEETGYTARTLIHLGAIEPNPAIQSNLCHSFLALDISPGTGQHLDPTEGQMDIVQVPLIEVPMLIAKGDISHALVVVAFTYLDLYEKGMIPSSCRS